VLWLPTVARPYVLAIYNSAIVIGCTSGRVILIRLATEGPPGSLIVYVGRALNYMSYFLITLPKDGS
jgi:hypothetical protein